MSTLDEPSPNTGMIIAEAYSAFNRRDGGKTAVKVHQLVKTLSGDVLSDTDVWHLYIIANALIEHMDLRESDPSAHQTPSAAFSKL